MPNPPPFNLSCPALRAVAHAIGTEETRYYLNGIFVEPCDKGGVLLVATDGHRLCAVRDAHGKIGRPAILSARWADQALITKRSEGDGRRLVLTEGKQAVVSVPTAGGGAFEAGSLLVEEIAGTFPDWRRVVPSAAFRKSPGAPVGFNPEYLGALAESGRALTRRSRAQSVIFSFHQASPADPALALCDMAPDALWVVMPAFVDGGRLPGWAPHAAAVLGDQAV